MTDFAQRFQPGPDPGSHEVPGQARDGGVRLFHVGMTSVLRLCLGLSVLLAGGAAQAGVADRLAGYVAGCEVALLAGDTAAFADLSVQTETVTETVEVYGWGGGDVVVSLLARLGDKRTGVCDVTYRPGNATASEIEQIALLSDHMATKAMTQTHKIEQAQAGQVILTCAGERGMALFLDPAAVGSGFAAQVATVPPHRMRCGG